MELADGNLSSAEYKGEQYILIYLFLAASNMILLL